jgi:hypothetical protein
MKVCSRCREEKARSEFNRSSSSKDGLRYQCRACQSIAHLLRRENPQARALAKANSARWYENNKEKNREFYNRWARENYSKVLARNVKRHADKLQRTPAWLTAEDLFAIEMTYMHAQALTELTGIPHEVDHILPLRGKFVSGLHVPRNLQVLPAIENQRKTNKWIPQ